MESPCEPMEQSIHNPPAPASASTDNEPPPGDTPTKQDGPPEPPVPAPEVEHNASATDPTAAKGHLKNADSNIPTSDAGAQTGLKDTKKRERKGGRGYQKKETTYKNQKKEVMSKYVEDYSRAYHSPGNVLKTSEVLDRVLDEFEFHFGFYFDPKLPEGYVPKDLPSLKEYDASWSLDLSGYTEDENGIRRHRVATERVRVNSWLHYRANGGARTAKPAVAKVSVLHGAEEPGKARSGWQEWQVQQKVKVDAMVDARFAMEKEAGILPADAKLNDLHRRQKITRALFLELPEIQQQVWNSAAVAVKKAAVEAYDKAVAESKLHTADSRQRAIDNIGAALDPLMQDIREHAGLHTLVYVYGPMPKDGGAIGCLTYCYGKNLDAAPRTFPAKFPSANAAHTSRLKTFVSTAYTADEIASATPTSESRVQKQTSGNVDTVIDVQEKDTEAMAASRETIEPGKGKGKTPVTPSTSSKRKRPASKAPSRSKSVSTDKEDEGNNHDGPDQCSDDQDDDDDEGSASDASEVGHTAKKSKYEIDRDNNIARNKALMESLGLGPKRTAAVFQEKAKTPTQAVKRKNTTSSDPVRRSLRKTGADSGVDANPEDVPSGVSSSVSMEAPGEQTRAAPQVNMVAQENSEMCVLGNEHSPAVEAASSVLREPSTGQLSPPPCDRLSPPKASTPTTQSLAPSPNRLPTPVLNMPTENETRAAMQEGSEVDVDMGDAGDTLSHAAEGDEDMEETLEDRAASAAAVAPEWFSIPYDAMSNVNMSVGPVWNRLIAMWTLLESEGVFARPLKKLPKGSRPEMLTKWMNGGRLRASGPDDAPREMPVLDPGDLKAFTNDFKKWWAEIAPKWAHGKIPKEYKGDDFGLLDTRGQCGWMSVVACLWWWGGCVGAGENKAAQKQFQQTLEKVTDVLEIVWTKGKREGKE